MIILICPNCCLSLDDLIFQQSPTPELQVVAASNSAVEKPLVPSVRLDVTGSMHPVVYVVYGIF